MITASHQKESLSIGYVTAAAAIARINLEIGRIHDYGVDGTFHAVARRFQGLDKNGNDEYRYVESGTKIDFQLKCTTQWTIRGPNIAWSIKNQAYNDIVSRPRYLTPLILVLMCLPEKEDEWLNSTEQRLMLRNCCYYAELSGPCLANENSTKLIEIPRTNVLTPNAINNMLSAVEARMAGRFYEHP